MDWIYPSTFVNEKQPCRLLNKRQGCFYPLSNIQYPMFKISNPIDTIPKMISIANQHLLFHLILCTDFQQLYIIIFPRMGI